jgi:RNA polymerase sigma-70 factor (ECF subfamily)
LVGVLVGETKPNDVPERVRASMESRAVGRHDAADFDDVFRDHYEAMVRSLAVACGDREVAADAVQDGFTRAYARWRRISRYDDPPAWIRRVALNRIRDHFRHTTRGRRVTEQLAGRATVEPGPAPGGPTDDLIDLVETLPQQQRIAISLFYIEQLSVQEVAESMGLSEGAVKYHLHAGRDHLRERLGTP